MDGWTILKPYMYINTCTVYAEIFVGEIFCGLNFRGVKFSWLKPPMKIGHHKILPPWQFARWKDVCWVQKKKLCVHGYHVYDDRWEAAVGETLVCIRESRNAHDRYAVAGGNYSWWENFRGFNFHGWGDPRKFQHNENFCIYSPCRLICVQVHWNNNGITAFLPLLQQVLGSSRKSGSDYADEAQQIEWVIPVKKKKKQIKNNVNTTTNHNTVYCGSHDKSKALIRGYLV